MAEYTQAVDAQISRLLGLKGRVTPDMIAGFDPAEAAELLARYVEVHAHEVALVIDDGALTWASVAPATTFPPAASGQSHAPAVSPVDQVIGMERGASLLDTKPAGGKVSGWLWLLPLSFGVIGGVMAWAIAKGTNRQVALALMWAGVAVTVVSGIAFVGMGRAIAPQLSAQMGAPAAGVTWPASETGKPVFYYFGTST